MTAAIVILEHRWAIPLRDAIMHAGGVALADRWLHPQDLLAVAPRSDWRSTNDHRRRIIVRGAVRCTAH